MLPHLLFSTFFNAPLPSTNFVNSSVEYSTTTHHLTWLDILHKLPYIILFIIAGVLAICLVSHMISACGFSSAGVVAGSYASRIQSAYHGGTIAPGSLFARCQSIGAAGLPCWAITLIFLIGGGLAVFGMIMWKRQRKLE